LSLRQHQESFLQDVSKLIVFIFSNGFSATGGELLRPDEMQKIYYETGRSNIKSGGYHQIKLAIDLNIFKDGVYLDKKTDKPILKPIADFWCSLNPLNRWGGDFSTIYDPYHFERAINQ